MLRRKNVTHVMLLVATAIVFTLVSCAPTAAPTPIPPPPSPAPKATSTQVARPQSSPTSALASLPTPTAALRAVPTATAAVIATPALQPKYGGQLVTGAYAEPPKNFESGSNEDSFYGPVFSRLVRLDPYDNSRVIGDMAERWEVKDEGKTIVFYLHRNVVSHDGVSVGAEDVKLSLERQTRKAAALGNSNFLAVRSAKFEVLDQYTVAIHLSTPHAGILRQMAGAVGSNAIRPKDILTRLASRPEGLDEDNFDQKNVIGTGAFKFAGYTLGAGSTMVRFDRYFVQGRPYLDKITNIGINDAATRLAAYVTGRIDLMYPIGLDATSAALVKKQHPDHNVRQLPESNNWQFIMKNQAPWTDIRVRKAVNLAFDRKAGIQVTDEGFGQMASYIAAKWGGPTEQEMASVPGFRYPKDQDMAEAKRLLTEAGYPNGLTFKLFHRAPRVYRDTAILYGSQLEPLGIKFTLDTPPDDATWQNRRYACQHDGYVHRGIPATDPDGSLFGDLYSKGYIGQQCGFSNPALDKLIDQQSLTFDPVERRRRLLQIEALARETLPYVQLHTSGYWVAAWPYVKGSGVEIFSDQADYKQQIDTWLSK